MDEILEMLKASHSAGSVALELPDEDLLVEIEEALLIQIPYDLREYLLEASDVICGHLEPVTVADPRSHTYLPEVTAVAWDLGMPREYIVVCEYNGGYAFITQEGRVGFWTREDGETGLEWESFWHWVQEEWLP